MNYIAATFIDNYYWIKQWIIKKVGLMEWQYLHDNKKADKYLKKMKAKGLIDDDE